MKKENLFKFALIGVASLLVSGPLFAADDEESSSDEDAPKSSLTSQHLTSCDDGMDQEKPQG